MKVLGYRATYLNTNKFIFFILFLITFLALLIRVKYVEQTEIYNPIRADAAQYVTYGYNLYYHGVFSKDFIEKPLPDSYRSPGYPILISLAFKIGGKHYFYPVVIYFQIVFSMLLVPLTFFIGRRFISQSLALLAAILTAISPHLVSMTSYLLTEILFSFVLLSAICFLCMALERKQVIFFVISGLFFGLSYLTNETAFFLPFIIIAVLIHYHIMYRNFTKKISIGNK